MSTTTMPSFRHWPFARARRDRALRRASCAFLLALTVAGPTPSLAQDESPAPPLEIREGETREDAKRRVRHERRAARRAEREKREADEAEKTGLDAAPSLDEAPDEASAEVTPESAATEVATPEEAAATAPSADEALSPAQRKEQRRRDRADPTTPIDDPPLLNVPMPGKAGQQEEEAAAETASVPGDPWGDVGTAGLLSLRAFFQFRYQSTYTKASISPRESYQVREKWLAEEGDGYSFNRLFVRIASNPSPYISFKAVFDFAQLLADDPEDVVKQTYVTLSPIPEHLELVAGMFKVPVSITELDSSNRWEFADFGQINGTLNYLGFASRDLGLMLLGNPLSKPKRLRMSFGIFRGDAKDEHDSAVGLISGRVEVNPNKHLRFGADFAHKTRGYTYNRPFETSSKEELPDPLDPLYPASRRYGKGKVATADVRYKRKGFMLRGEGVYGDRTDLDLSYGAKTFWGGWGIIAKRIDCGSFELLPAFRAEWMDANREAPTGVYRTLSGAVSVLFLERLRFVFDVTHTEVQANTPLMKQPEPIQREPYLALDNLKITAQLQLEL